MNTEDAEKKREFHRVKTKLYTRSFARGFYPFSLAIDKISVKNNRSEILRKNRLFEHSEFRVFLGFSRLFS
ncbi:hypothetical protein [uncultured Ilyobacter sp.]|uniref:hypothetical protein n=1 Tax=uncultured Ilyobacter sp. TaxID=544433 RepID=UPI0029F4AE13|nr:hypothetical protein [uncultured Ilyobacter sp.]